MYELSLFSGIGGGLLGTLLLGWTPVGYVENNDYCQRVIAQRITDGFLPDAPIFGDIHAFIGDGFAASYTGMVDVVTAGFPCQPFAAGGKHRGERDERNLWPETIRTIRIVKPEWVYLENSPRLLAWHGKQSPYIRTVIGDLAESGYVGRWGVLSAAALGFPHRRDRLWIVANSGAGGRPRFLCRDVQRVIAPVEIKERARKQAATLESICRYLEAFEKRTGQPAVFRGNDGVPFAVERLAAIGNGQVPAVVARVWRLLGMEE